MQQLLYCAACRVEFELVVLRFLAYGFRALVTQVLDHGTGSHVANERLENEIGKYVVIGRLREHLGPKALAPLDIGLVLLEQVPQDLRPRVFYADDRCQGDELLEVLFVESAVLAELREQLGAALAVADVGDSLGAGVVEDVGPEGGLVELGHLVEGEGEVFVEFLLVARVQVDVLVVTGVPVPPSIIEPQIKPHIHKSQPYGVLLVSQNADTAVKQAVLVEHHRSFGIVLELPWLLALYSGDAVDGVDIAIARRIYVLFQRIPQVLRHKTPESRHLDGFLGLLARDAELLLGVLGVLEEFGLEVLLYLLVIREILDFLLHVADIVDNMIDILIPLLICHVYALVGYGTQVFDDVLHFLIIFLIGLINDLIEIGLLLLLVSGIMSFGCQHVIHLVRRLEIEELEFQVLVTLIHVKPLIYVLIL